MSSFHDRGRLCSAALALAALVLPASAQAQTALNLRALGGLAPFGALPNTSAGMAALAANYSVTGAIQTGTAGQPALQPFGFQQQQALSDAFITSANGTQLADGLGSKLGAVYRSLALYASADYGKTTTITNVSPAVATLIGYTSALSGADSNAAKYFFGNATYVNGKTTSPLSKDALDIFTAAGVKADAYGIAYHVPAGSPGSDPNGDSRPFQTEKTFVGYAGTDYFGAPALNVDYLAGPAQPLVASPAFPSGHTTYGYTESLLLALLVPERYTQMIARGAEYGNSRIVLGAHYAMDVIGGRTLAYYDLAQLLAGTPGYAGQTFGRFTVTDYAGAFAAAKADLDKALESGCGKPVAVCAQADGSRFKDGPADAAFYESTQTYGLPVVFASTASKVEDVGALAPEAGHLLTAAFPKLTLAQADRILTETEGPGGGFLDNGRAFGLYSRLDLYKAGERAASLSAAVTPGHS